MTPSKPHKVVQALLKDASGKDISAQVQVDDVMVAIDGKPLDEVIAQRTESIAFCVRCQKGTLRARSLADSLGLGSLTPWSLQLLDRRKPLCA